MRIGAAIYQHTDGRWEARYRKGRKPDGTVIYGSVYGKTYEEAERKRAELLQELALRAANGESEEALRSPRSTGAFVISMPSRRKERTHFLNR